MLEGNEEKGQCVVDVIEQCGCCRCQLLVVILMQVVKNVYVEDLFQCVGYEIGGGDMGDKQVEVGECVEFLLGIYIEQR